MFAHRRPIRERKRRLRFVTVKQLEGMLAAAQARTGSFCHFMRVWLGTVCMFNGGTEAKIPNVFSVVQPGSHGPIHGACHPPASTTFLAWSPTGTSGIQAWHCHWALLRSAPGRVPGAAGSLAQFLKFRGSSVGKMTDRDRKGSVLSSASYDMSHE